MSSARAGGAADPRMGPKAAWPRALEWAAKPVGILALGLLLALGLSSAAILSGPGAAPPWPEDQSFVEIVDLNLERADGVWQFRYPRLGHSGGITSSLVVGIYKLFVPVASSAINHHAKILGAALYFGTSWLLGRSLLRTRTGSLLFAALVGTAGFQFFEPTSEVLAGSLFNLFLVGAVLPLHPVVTTAFLGGFALAKADCLPIMVSVAAVWLGFECPRAHRVRALGALALSTGALLAPSLYLYGDWDLGSSRGVVAFGQHYSWLRDTGSEDAALSRDGGDWRRVFEADFPGAESVVDVVRDHPERYLEFLGLSIRSGILGLLAGLQGLVAPLVLSAASRQQPKPAIRAARLALTCLAVTFVLATAFATLHVRYLARVYPALALVAVVFLEATWRRVGFRPKHWPQAISLAAVGLTLVVQSLSLDRHAPWKTGVERPALLGARAVGWTLPASPQAQPGGGAAVPGGSP